MVVQVVERIKAVSSVNIYKVSQTEKLVMTTQIENTITVLFLYSSDL